MADQQMHLVLIPHKVENVIVPQREQDGYVNATAMCQACGKKLNHYISNRTTQDFLQELESDTGIPVSELVVIRKGGTPLEQGTWVHPDVAINLGQWCSSKFAVAVSRWVREWMSGKLRRSGLPYHLDRYLDNADSIPRTHFSILNEMTMNLIAPLERHGYTLPDKMLPDISEGKMFANWLREEKGIDPAMYPSYPHRYADGRIVEARLYPMSLLEDFRDHFHEVWMPKRMVTYFQERDTMALGFVAKAFPKLFGAPGRALSQ